jgi:hypothetical protein
MKLTEDINKDVAENPVDEKKSKLFYAMLNGQTVSDTISTSMGDFTVKFPKQKDIIAIGRIAAFMRGGIPATAFDAVSEYEIQKCATLDVMISGGPAWFEKVRQKDKNFSWRDVPDAHFVNEVYAKALEFRQGVQNQLTGNTEIVAENPDRENAGDIPPDVGDGLFSGVASTSEGIQS